MADLPNLANRERAVENLDYVARVNRALDYIQRHLGEPLNLDDVAKAASFSPFHFHRIFHALVGETLNVFVKRVRLERALYLRAHHVGKSLTEIALACGFASSSDFSRSFRKQYGVSPRTFDFEAFRREQRKELKLERLPAGENPDNFAVTLRDYPPRRVAYLRVRQPFQPGNVSEAAARLVRWAQERGFANGQWLGYMWESPDIVPLDKCRYDVGVELPSAAPSHFEGEIGVTSFAAMKVAELALAGTLELEQRAFDWLYRTWLPRSGFAPDHQPAFEAWEGLPFAHGDAHFELRVQLPVVDAARAL